MMKILHIIPTIRAKNGGPSTSVASLCRSLAKEGMEVTLYTTAPDEEQKLSNGSAKPSYNIEYFRYTRFKPFIHSLSSPDLIQALTDTWRQFDLLHMHSLWNPIASLAIKNARKHKIKYCISTHGTLDPVVLNRHRWMKIPWSILWERANIEGAALVHFTAEAELEKARLSGYKFQKTVVIPNIVDSSEWQNLPPKTEFELRFPQVNGKEVVLFVGRIDWVKNLDKLIESISIVRRSKPSTMLVCVGPDNFGLQAGLEKLASGLNIREHVLFTGMLTGRELRAAYARADAFALVSQKENFGLTAAEALSCGIPVVLSKGVDLWKELPPNGPFLVINAIPEEIASALIEMLKFSHDNGLPNRDAQNIARSRWDCFLAKRYICAYKELLTPNL